MKIEFIKWDTGDNLHCLIDGEKYKFATAEFYGGSYIYGVCFPDGDFYVSFTRSKKAYNFYLKIKPFLDTLILNNPIAS